jgi:hypothetical protein
MEVAKEIVRWTELIVNRSKGDNVVHLEIYVNQLCLANIPLAINLIFDETIDERIRDYIMDTGMKEESWTCDISINQEWVLLMRKFVIPRLNELPNQMRGTIEWYQRTHGL